MAFPHNVDGTWVNPTTYDAAEMRRADTTAFAGTGASSGVQGGVVRHGNNSLTVTVDGSDVVTVQPGSVVIPGNAVTGTGCYRTALPASITGSLTARNATNGRIDLLVFRQMDTDVVGTHGAYTSRIELIAGTPSGSPAVPVLPDMAVELARITVPNTGGGAASVDLTNRTYAAAIEGILPVPSFSKLPTIAAKYQRARLLDSGLLYYFDGSWLPEKPAWVTLTGFAAGFSAKSGTYTPAYRLWPDGRIDLRGGVDKSSNLVNNETVLTLPAAARPASDVSVTAAFSRTTGAAAARLDIPSTGVVKIITDSLGTAGAWVSLDNVRYDTT